MPPAADPSEPICQGSHGPERCRADDLATGELGLAARPGTQEDVQRALRHRAAGRDLRRLGCLGRCSRAVTALEQPLPLHARRQRDGAFGWGIVEDLAQQGAFVEIFRLEARVEHLRQPAVTRPDRDLGNASIAFCFQVGGPPKVTHLIAASVPWHKTERRY